MLRNWQFACDYCTVRGVTDIHTTDNPLQDADDNVRRVVKILMARDGMDQNTLAARLGFEQSVASRALQPGGRRWKLADIRRLAEVFDVPIALLFEDPNNLIRSRWSSPLVAA